MPKNWKSAKVNKIIELSPSTRSIEIILEEELSFDAGQFITFDLPIGIKRLDRWRSYSIASDSTERKKIELCIANLEGGRASNFFFKEIKVGDELQFKGPAGNFCIPQDENRKIVMICTGTGVAPFRSMIFSHKFDLLSSKKNIHLIYGTRYKTNILYEQEFLELENISQCFEYNVTLSRDKDENYHHGYVHSLYQDRYLPVQKNIVFYICGWSKMVDEAVASLKKAGYAPEQIKVELYG